MRIDAAPEQKMDVFVRVLSGLEAGRTIPLRAGQVARFGRTEWADFGFPSDARLGEVHFELRCGSTGEVTLRNLDAGGTLLDGVPVAESPLRSGQKISAGQTVFSVTFGPAGGFGGRMVDGATAPVAGHPGVSTFRDAGTAAEICDRFSLTFEVPVPEAASPGEFVSALVAGGALREALRFQSFRLPKRHAVWWAWRCLTEPPGGVPADSASTEALEAARRWIIDPTDETARRAGAAAESLGYGPAAAWVAASAFWSGDNIAPPVTSAVAPPEHLTGTAVSAAVLLGSIAAKPDETAARQRAFLVLADRIVRGEDGPPLPGAGVLNE